jgi:hypothetical protein
MHVMPCHRTVVYVCLRLRQEVVRYDEAMVSFVPVEGTNTVQNNPVLGRLTPNHPEFVK